MKVIVFDDVLVRRAREYELPNLDLQFFAHADDAVAIVGRERPDVVLMDYAMAAQNSGEEAIRALRAAYPRGNGSAKIVAISSDERSNERMLAAGADDAVPKSHVKGYLSRLSKLK